MELGRTCDHLGAHATLTTKDSVGDAPKEAGIVVGGGAEYVAGFVESNAPCVVVELVKEFHVRAIGTKAKGSRSEIVLFAVYLAVETRVTDGAVNPVVKTVTQVAWACVGVTYTESGEENFAVIGFVVAIGILKEEKFRSMGENDATTGKNHRGGYVEAVGKYGEFVCFSIAVGIFANLYSIITLATWFQLVGIVDRLDHPEAPAFVPLEVNGIDDLGFGSKQFESKTNRCLRVFHAFLWREGQLIGKGFGSALVVGHVVAFFVLKGGARG